MVDRIAQGLKERQSIDRRPKECAWLTARPQASSLDSHRVSCDSYPFKRHLDVATICTLPSKSPTHWNCIGQAGNDGNQDRGCSHFNANCGPGPPNKLHSAVNRPMDLLQNQFYSGGRVRDETREDWTRRAGKVPHIDAGAHFMREKKGFRSVPILLGVT